MAPGKNSSRLLAPGPPRPTAINNIQSLGPVTATGGGDYLLVFFFLKKQKDKKVTVSYKHRVLSFKTLKKKSVPAQGTEHQKPA